MPIISTIRFAQKGFFITISQKVRKRRFKIKKTGNRRPKKAIGQKILGLTNGAK
tara:strand:+ start:1475 stop:1636 length:162 start_codon:yes stop_codon:yes gene_type:complete